MKLHSTYYSRYILNYYTIETELLAPNSFFYFKFNNYHKIMITMLIKYN